MAYSSLTFIRQWLQDPSRVAGLVTTFMEKNGFSPTLVRFKKGEAIVHEGQLNDLVHILLSGIVQLTKKRSDNEMVAVAELRPGSLVGLVSFVTRSQAVTSAIPTEDCELIRMTRDEFDQFSTHTAEMTRMSQNLIIGNMLDRYDHILSLHFQMDQLNTDLELERNHLKEALEQLEMAQQRLISQEKMALLGELVSGVAHEINNPTAALMRAADHLGDHLPKLGLAEHGSKYVHLFDLGLHRVPINTADQRLAMTKLEVQYPDLPRSIVRTMSQLQIDALESLCALLDETNPSESENREKIARDALMWFEAGSYIKNIRTASERIARMVHSLKGYSRQDQGMIEMADVREGLRDTLILLGARLQHIDVELELNEVPLIRCNPAELNQVWTNIISNAAEAMGGEGRIRIESNIVDEYVSVSIEDYGPGIPDELKDRIFQASFTTKHTGAQFGLGLGLAISTEIINKHGGTISVSDIDHPGARFEIRLPVVS